MSANDREYVLFVDRDIVNTVVLAVEKTRASVVAAITWRSWTT